MSSFSDTILARPHMRPFATQSSTHSTYLTEASSTLIQYTPLSTLSSSTLIEYTPLSLTTSSASNYRHTTSTASTKILPSSSSMTDPSQSVHANHQTTDLPTGFAIVVLILLGLMLAMATMMWLAESKGRQESQRSGSQEHKTMKKVARNAEPVGLGITLYPAVEERREIRDYGRLKGWLSIIVDKGKSVDMIRRWIEFAVSRARTDLQTNAEEGLLLAVRESERMGSEKIQIELDADRGH